MTSNVLVASSVLSSQSPKSRGALGMTFCDDARDNLGGFPGSNLTVISPPIVSGPAPSSFSGCTRPVAGVARVPRPWSPCWEGLGSSTRDPLLSQSAPSRSCDSPSCSAPSSSLRCLISPLTISSFAACASFLITIVARRVLDRGGGRCCWRGGDVRRL